MIPFLLQSYREGRQQPELYLVPCNCSTRYYALQFLQVLRAFSEASDSICKEVVRLGGLRELAAAIQMDPTWKIQGTYLYSHVLHSACTIWHILLAGDKEEVRKYPEIQNGTPLPLLYCILLNSKIISIFNSNFFLPIFNNLQSTLVLLNFEKLLF